MTKSPLVQHDPAYRRLWMFSRPKRKIEPWKVAQMLSEFQDLLGTRWSGNQFVQNEWRRNVGRRGLVRDGEPYHQQSGGPRTYAAQLKSLGLLYKSDAGTIEFTLAGQDICDSAPPLAVLHKQLFRHQYPSSYSLSIGIHPKIRVKPFLFVLNLLQLSGINSLTEEELAIPVIFGHNHDCEPLCAEKILELRNGARLIDLVEHDDLYTVKMAGKPTTARLNEVLTIANTCKNFLESTLLIRPIERGGRRAYEFNSDYQGDLEQARADQGKFIPNVENEVSFQRSYGSWNRTKDTRSISPTIPRPNIKDGLIRGYFFDFYGTNPVGSDINKAVDHIHHLTGVSKDSILKVVESLQSRAADFFESNYLQLAMGGAKTATSFEKATANIFNDSLKIKSQWTGAHKRSRNTKGAYADILLDSPYGGASALADAKATPAYDLPSSDYYKLVGNYIKNFKELPGSKETLAFCLYVAAGFSTNFDVECGKAYKESGVSCAGLRAKDLLSLTKKPADPQRLWNQLSTTGLVKLRN